MKILYTNAKILTSEFEIINGELVIENELITFSGEKYDGLADKTIDVKANLIIAGFKNAHSHSAMTFLRSYADDLPLDKWLFDCVLPREEKLTPNDVYTLTKLACLEYFRNGITAAFDMYFFPEEIARAAVDMGLRLVLCGASSGGAEALPLLEERFNTFNNYNPLVSYKLGFHAEYTSSPELWKGVAGLAKKYKTGVNVHLQETKKETDACIAKYGKSAVQYFNDLGVWDYGGSGFHSVWVDDDDIDIMSKKGVTAVINSSSNLKLASGIADVEKLRKSGVKLALGTDGAASNNALDFFREMYLTAVLAKVKSADASALPATEVLKAAVCGGAEVMGLLDCVSLSVGQKADFVIIDLDAPNMHPKNNILKNLVYAGNPSNVLTTVINGKTVYDNGKYFINEDVDKIFSDVNKIIKRTI